MLVRFEKKAHNYLALIHFACTMIAMKEAKVQKALVMRNREREQNKLRMRRVGEAQVSTNEAEKHICNYTREQ